MAGVTHLAASRGNEAPRWGTVVPLSDPAFLRHVEWLRHRRLSEQTVKLREVVLGAVMRHAAGKPLAQITAEDLEAWDKAMGLSGLSDSSRATYVHQARTYFAWAVAFDGLPLDPSLRLVAPKLARARPRPIKEADLAMAVASAPPRIRPWLELAGWAGFRAREVSLLTRDAILDDLAEPVVIADGKGRRERAVPLAPRVWESLLAHGLPEDGYVFRRLDGDPGPVLPYRVSRLASEHLHSIGIDCTLHQLRHRFLTQLYRETKDIRLVQEIAGHSSPNTTAIYTDFDHRAASAAVAKLGALSA